MNINRLFEGRLKRVDFIIGSIILSVVLSVFSFVPYLSIIAIILGILLSYSMSVRRAHDFNQNFIIVLALYIVSIVSSVLPLLLMSSSLGLEGIGFITIFAGIGSIVTLVLCLMILIKKDKKDNKYGVLETKSMKLKNIIFGNLFEKEIDSKSNMEDIKSETKTEETKTN